ncbi:NlpC/P60 family protein, partial [Actinomycetaceae bacterium UMB8039B]
DGWHYRKPSGEVGLGWQRVGLDWYYLEPSTGIMANAGRTIDGKWYNFLSSGQWVNYQAPAGYLQPTMSIQSLGWATNTLTYGMNGVKVRIVQQRLGIWHTMKLASVDSSFMSAVRNFQRRAGLPQTGVVDERTWNAMGTGYSWYVDQYQVAPTVSVSASRSEHIEAMISYALAQVGSPYTWGGAGPYNLGFDCSGLVLQALHAGGLDPQPINVLKHAWPDYRTSQELYNYSGFQYLPLSQRQRGDLIFYTSGGVVTHVSLYLGNERVVHTDWMGNPARVDSVWTSYGYSNTAPWVIRPFP